MSVRAAGPLTPIGYLAFEGRQLAIHANDTIAACFLRAGVLATRRTKGGEPRGMFCGIGVCHDCLVTVDGMPNVRACMTLARPGSIVARGGW